MIGEALCLLLGDSNALKLAPYKPQCENVSVNHIDSNAIVAMAPPDRGYRLVIVSMGGNDHSIRNLPHNLATVRARYRDARFAWVAPVGPNVAAIIIDFAKAHHDRYVAIADFPNHGGHPMVPSDVARALPD